MSKQSEYEDGVKYGKKSSEANDFMDDMSTIVVDFRSDSRRKGEEYGREQRHESEARAKASAESSRSSEASSDDYSSSSSSSDYGGYSGSSDSSYGGYSSSSNPVGGFLKFVLGALGLVISLSMCTSMSDSSKTSQNISSNSESTQMKQIKNSNKVSFFITIHPPEPLIFQGHSPTPFSRAFTHLG